MAVFLAVAVVDSTLFWPCSSNLYTDDERKLFLSKLVATTIEFSLGGTGTAKAYSINARFIVNEGDGAAASKPAQHTAPWECTRCTLQNAAKK